MSPAGMSPAGMSPAGMSLAGMSRASGRPGWLVGLGALALALGLAGIAFAWTSGVVAGDDDRTIEIGMRYSAFSSTDIVVTAGRPVVFVLSNGDPIDHEWLVGDAAFHERHRIGTDAHHGARPDEVSVPAGMTVTTTITFRSPGEYSFVCHLPGHEAYGMVGVVRVVAASS
jgi:uncharacterized cupredoxin-like copper-binding protein